MDVLDAVAYLGFAFPMRFYVYCLVGGDAVPGIGAIWGPDD